MDIIVQKFGGTSVANHEGKKALLEHVKDALEEGGSLVLVVSAMGRIGDPYATDTLIGLMEDVHRDISPKKKDLMISCGEIISASLISHYLEANGIPSEPLTGAQAGIVTTDNYGNSKIININTKKIKELLNKGKVVVVAGFQGATLEGEMTTLGRGGSDTSAVVLGGYLGAKRVDIFTDVPGIALTDPRVISSVPYLSKIKSEDMFKLADNGAKVIHPRAVKAAISFGIPVRVRSTFTRDLGTLISNEDFHYEEDIIGLAFNKDESKTHVYILFKDGYREELEDRFNSYFQGDEDILYTTKWAARELMFDLPTDSFRDIINGFYEYIHDKEVALD